MNINISAFSKQLAGTSELFLRKHGPVILTTAGVTGFVATAVLAGKAALKSRIPAWELRGKLEKVTSKELDKNYTRKDRGRETAQIVFRDGFEIVKIWAPVVIVGSASAACIVASHGMMRSQKAALAAAYTALDTGYRAYRERVRQELGPEKELELYRGFKVIQKEPDEEGNIPPCEVDLTEKRPSQYARFFDYYNPNWNKSPEYNVLFLRSQEQWANNRLQAYGFIFLNEVYEALGFKRTQEGQVVGWRKDAGPLSDGFVSFGIYDIFDESSRAFVNGEEAVIMLDFNVDGPIII